MDGFHLANSELSRLGRAARKGAPETFDAYGFVALLRRLRADDEPVVYAPTYSRTLHESIGSAIAVSAATRIVVVEGNYLLLPTAPWDGCAKLLDLSIYLETSTDLRVPALVRRQRSRGLDRAAAHDWVTPQRRGQCRAHRHDARARRYRAGPPRRALIRPADFERGGLWPGRSPAIYRRAEARTIYRRDRAGSSTGSRLAVPNRTTPNSAIVRMCTPVHHSQILPIVEELRVDQVEHEADADGRPRRPGPAASRPRVDPPGGRQAARDHHDEEHQAEHRDRDAEHLRLRRSS